MLKGLKSVLIKVVNGVREITRRKIKRLCVYDLYCIFGDDAVYYVGGSEALPPPLCAEDEARLVEMLNIENECEYARSVLIEHNLRLVVYIAKRFENTKIGIEDLVSIGTVGLMKAINTFHSDRNIKLATYASRCIENEILMYIRKNSHNRNDISLEEPLNVDWDGNELLLSDVLGTDEDSVLGNIEREEETAIIHEAVGALDDRDRQIIEMRYGLGVTEEEKTQKEVADELGISQSYISRLEKKIISKLKEKISGFYF